MATRSASSRRVWVQPVPEASRRRPVRGLLKLMVAAFFLAGGTFLYFMHVYAPGLRASARTIPSRVEQQLSARGAPYVPSQAISPDLRHAIVAIEDRRFYQHPGIDPIGILRAAWVNVTNGHIDQGGSTLEQQLAKRVIVHDDRTLHGKLRTAALAWAIDQEFSKARIIELYLNAAYYGQGAYGVAEAAHTYFGTDALHLTLPEAAFIAALPQAPSVYGDAPTAPPILQRWHRVLQDMEQLGYITPGQEQSGLDTRLTFALPNP